MSEQQIVKDLDTDKIKIISHLFESWDKIPDVSHLLSIENNYVDTFLDHEPNITYVSYAMENNKIVAFGSASYYNNEYNYYCDEDDDADYIENQLTRQLWIEGLVSTVSGCGTLVLAELEKCLMDFATNHPVSHKIINVMSVNDSVGFYENNGYIVCHTSPRFGGTDNTRLAKAFNQFSIESTDYIDYKISDEECLAWEIAGAIFQGRLKFLGDYINIPKSSSRDDLKKYILENYNDIFKDNISQNLKDKILECIEEIDS
jgi:hypothetical protein